MFRRKPRHSPLFFELSLVLALHFVNPKLAEQFLDFKMEQLRQRKARL